MRVLILSLISSAVLLSGCATTAPNNPWVGLDTDISPAVAPSDCGSFPLPSESYPTRVVYDKAGLNDLNAYRLCSEDNEAIAGLHAKQIGQLKIARKGLTEAGQSQRNIADMRQTMLQDERRHHLYSSVGYWIAIIGMGLAL